jgi:hypothetical protein
MIKSVHCMSIYYILLLFAHIGLIWLLPYVPTQDGPSHIYNLVILHDLLNGGKEWGNFFVDQLRAVPNLGFILLSYPLLHFFNPLVVERIFLSFYIVLMGASVPFFLRTFEKPVFPVSYFVFPVIFNYTLLMGFYSYIVAVPLFLVAFSLAWRIRDRSATYKFVCFNIIGLVLFYFHLIPFVFFMLSLVIAALVESTGYKKKVHNLLKLLIILAPSIITLFYYLKSTTNNFIPDFSYLLSTSRFIRLITELLFFSSVNFLPWQLLPASLFIYLIVSLAYYSAKDINKNRLCRGNTIPSEKILIYLLSILIFIYLFAPLSIGDGWYFNQRFPWVILLVSLPLLRIPETTILFRRIVSIATPCIVGIFFLFNIVILRQQSSKIEKFMSGLHTELPKGSFVMTYKTKDPEMVTVDVLLHAASYYGIFRGCVDVGNYEVDTDLFPVRFSKNVPAMLPEYQTGYKAKSINWENYPGIQYLLGWEIDNRERKALSKYFYVIWEQDQFNIWKRKV